jgi:hypothetical protein
MRRDCPHNLAEPLMLYTNLSVAEPGTALDETNNAIRRAHELLKAVPENPPTSGLELTANTTALLIQRLELDLNDLENALAKKRVSQIEPRATDVRQAGDGELQVGSRVCDIEADA